VAEKTFSQRLQRDLRMRFDPELAEAVSNYHQTMVEAGMAGNMTDTVRELIRLGLANAPSDVATLMTRARAFNLVRVWVFQHVHQGLAKVLQELEYEITPEVLKAYGLPPLPQLDDTDPHPNDEEVPDGP
jgi:hypothetical protein